jgi:hypothetical protein
MFLTLALSSCVLGSWFVCISRWGLIHLLIFVVAVVVTLGKG